MLLSTYVINQFSSFQLLSHVQLCNSTDCSMPGFSVHQSLLKLMPIQYMMPSNHLILCRPLLLLPSIFPNISVFSQWVSSSHQVARVLELQLQNQSLQWIFRMISFRMDWFDLLVLQGTLKSLLQHHNLKVSILWHLAFFMVQLSHPYMTTGKTKLWLYGPSLEKRCLCFLTCCLGLA